MSNSVSVPPILIVLIMLSLAVIVSLFENQQQKARNYPLHDPTGIIVEDTMFPKGSLSDHQIPNPEAN